jgi:hypothetical protein
MKFHNKNFTCAQVKCKAIAGDVLLQYAETEYWEKYRMS